MTFPCVICDTPTEPKTRNEKNAVMARYRCPQCKCRWYVCWLLSALGAAA